MPRTTIRLVSLAALMLGAAIGATPAHADVAGFSDFAPVNTNGHGAGLGLGGDKTMLTLTDGGPDETTSAFARVPQRVTSWTASFTYQVNPGVQGGGDGVAFVLQNDPRGVQAIGDTSAGNALGYGGKSPIARSAAFLLHVFSASGAAAVTNGAAPSFNDTDTIDLRGGHPIRVTLAYDGAVLTETFQDLTTSDSFTQEDALDIPKAVEGATARVGFSGASGQATAVQTVRDFVFTVRPDVPPGRRKRLKTVAKVHNSRSSYVDPFIGTAGGGNTFPGPSAPFGMVQFSPDTRAPSIGYEHGGGQIQGFSMTHLSGVGCDDEGDVFLTATTGPIKTQVADYQSGFSHRRESASPGAYSVRLSKWDVNAELTATEHAGLVRFTFPAGQPGNILVPLSHTLTKTRAARLQIVGTNEIQGSVTSQSFCGANQYYTVYFVMKLDQPFQTCGTFAGEAVTDGARTVAQTENQPGIGAYLSYGAGGPRTVTARIGISYVDLDGARRNLDGEAGTRSFDVVRAQTAKKWENELRVIDVDGGTDDQRTIFYTALYHCLLMPSLFSDADGRYLGYDNQIHQMPAGHALYANYSGWDIYRSEAPLLALIAPQRMQDMCQSVVLMYQQGGWIDRWPQANTYTNVMCGSPLTSLLATAWGYGLRGFDMATAYEGMWKDATQRPPPGKPYGGESNVEYIDKLGYIPDDKEGYGSVSQTEEDCYAYAALSYIADSLGKTSDAAYMRKRALAYKNLFDPETKFLRPKLADGTWRTPFDPAKEPGYVEGTGWHYRWLAPQDVSGLISLFGGDAAFNAEMDKFFGYTTPTWSGQYYNPYNETDLEAPFLYNWSGKPFKTQARVRELLADAYGIKPDGIPGNDDCGTMSAWCVFAAMGLYPTDPARPAFSLCSPLFPKITLHLGAPYQGRTFTIQTSGKSADPYIQSARLNGRAHGFPWITQALVARGGSLNFTLGATPNMAWGASPSVRPPSLTH